MNIKISSVMLEETASITVDSADCLPALCRKLGKERKGDAQILMNFPVSSSEKLKEVLETAICGLYDGAYRFAKTGMKNLRNNQLFENRDGLSDFGDCTCTFVTDQIEDTEKEAIIKRGQELGICKGYARTLGNLPNNYLHTEDMVCYARKLAESLRADCQVFDDVKLRKMGCGGLLAVNQGSKREAAMVVLRYEGAPGEELIGLVGKGLMFDSGGYHLKSIDGMNGMKYDMCGAAGILESFEVLVRRKVRKNLVAVLMLAENVISPDAVKMGDVITTLAGKTVEVYNTDAEGRLVLCDGITYVQQQGAKTVLDLATLTYSAQAALGDAVTGLFVNNDLLWKRWMDTARYTGEKFWRLPLDPYYHNLLNWSICADFANYASGKGAGASVAACFLENFVEEGTRWIHLDMVGPSVVRSETEEMAEGASGSCISTIVKFLEQSDMNCMYIDR
ncbi:leucyl aminopeptidase family protein [bacterium]|nr:leucyl aminopeptidase family protein [bacterium]MDY3023466.1 M17 family metallopeptidase [Oliverpabstia sp.]